MTPEQELELLQIIKAARESGNSEVENRAMALLRGGDSLPQGGSIANAIGEGAALGWSGEIAGALGATLGKILPASWGGLPDGVSWQEAYRGIRDQADRDKSAFEQRNPKTSFAAEIAGGALTGGVGAGRAAGMSAARNIPRYVRYAGAGAAPGAVAGAGYADEGATGAGAVSGAVMGGAMGAAVPVVANAVKGVVRQIQNALGRSTSYAEQKLIEAMARDGVTPGQIIRRLQQRPGTVVPDVAGENVRGLTRAAAAFPGQVKNRAENFLMRRQASAGDRIKQAVYRGVSDDDNVYDMIDLINREARDQARPLYEQAYRVPVDLTDDLSTLLKRPSVARAWKKAKELAGEEGVDLPEMIKVEDGKVVDIIEIPDMRSWDYIKRGLDDVVSGYTDDFGRIKGTVGKAVDDTRKELNKILEDMNPVWKEAKQVWSGKIRYEEALKRGMAFLREDADLSKRAIQAMTDRERDMFRVGVAKAIRDKINKMGDTWDVSKRIFGNKDMREKLRLVFPDNRAFREFQRTMLREQTMARTQQKVLGNSVTGRLEGEKADLMVDPSALTEAARGNYGGAMQSALQWATNRMNVPSERLGNQLTGMLFDPAQQIPTMQRLGNSAVNYQIGQQLGAGLLGFGGTQLGRTDPFGLYATP